MANKRYYWLKLMKDFFVQARIKKLRRIAGGDTYVVIYLKMMLLSINSDGVITFEGVEETIEEELALILDEEVDNVKVLLAYLMANKLCVQKDDSQFYMVEVPSLVGSETASTRRSRKHREKQKVLQCNTTATSQQQLETKSNTEKEIEGEIEILDDEEEDEIKKYVLEISQDELKFDEVISDFMEFITMGDKSVIKNRYLYSVDIKNKLLKYDRRTIQNFKTFLKNQEVVFMIKNNQ